MVVASDAMEVEKVPGTVDCSMKSDLREEHRRRLAYGMEWNALIPAGRLVQV